CQPGQPDGPLDIERPELDTDRPHMPCLVLDDKEVPSTQGPCHNQAGTSGQPCPLRHPPKSKTMPHRSPALFGWRGGVARSPINGSPALRAPAAHVALQVVAALRAVSGRDAAAVEVP